MLAERCVVISGASRGIGMATAQRLLQGDTRVIAIARDFSSTPPALTAHPAFTALPFDLTQTAEIEPWFRRHISPMQPDALICNAGSGFFGTLEQYSTQRLQQELSLNLLSHIELCRVALPAMKRLPRSDVVFVGSESALQGRRFGSVYSAAKFGLRGFAQALRHECASRNCHVAIVNPGAVRSDFFDTLGFEPGAQPQHALALEDVASAIEHILLSPDHAVIDEINLSPLQHVMQKKTSKQPS